MVLVLCSNRVEVAYKEAVALKRQEELIREEEAAGVAETEKQAKKEAAEKEKRSKKKQVGFFDVVLMMVYLTAFILFAGVHVDFLVWFIIEFTVSTLLWIRSFIHHSLMFN